MYLRIEEETGELNQQNNNMNDEKQTDAHKENEDKKQKQFHDNGASRKIQILRNGNLLPAMTLKGTTTIRFDNTCAFDAVTQIIAAGIADFKMYADALSEIDNIIVRAAISLIR